jgi:SAM-dependent methyltransferase
MTGIADSSAELTNRVFPQHQAAITLLGQILADPNIQQIDWLDVGCGKGQILAQLDDNIPNKDARARISYCGYDLENSYSKAVEKKANELGLRSVEVTIGEMQHFANIFPVERKFLFVSFTNTIHELNPRFLPSLVINLILRLAPEGILYIYDMESLSKPELGAVTWDGNDFKTLLILIFEQYGCAIPLLTVQRWNHSSCSGWSVSINRKHLGITDDLVANKMQEVIASAADKVNVILGQKIEKITEELERLTVSGSLENTNGLPDSRQVELK